MQSYLRLIVGIVCISFAAVFVRASTVPPTSSVFYRMIFGGIAMLCIVLYRRDSLWNGFLPFVVALVPAICFSFDLYNWHKSIFLVGPGMATLLVNLQVFMVALLGAVFFKEKINNRMLLAMPVAIAGIYLLVGSQHHSMSYIHGLVLGLVAALGYASYILSLRVVGKYQQTGYVYLVYICLFMAIILGSIGLYHHTSFAIPDAYNLVLLISYGVICQAIGWLLIASSIRDIDVAIVALLLLLQPGLAFIWDIIIFHRATTAIQYFGLAITLLAIFQASIKGKKV